MAVAGSGVNSPQDSLSEPSMELSHYLQPLVFFRLLVRAVINPFRKPLRPLQQRFRGRFPCFYVWLRDHVFAYPVLSLTPSVKACFQPVLEPAQVDLMLSVIETFQAEVQVPFMLASGTLKGALLFKGNRPWDDDIDVYCKLEDRDRVIAACRDSERLGFMDDSINEGLMPFSKVYLKSSPYPVSNRGKDYHWPFIDIFWLEALPDGSYRDTFHKFKLPAHAWFPAQPVAFHHLTLSAPHHALAVKSRIKADSFKHAYFPTWDHVHECSRLKSRAAKVRLTDLASLYPILNETLPIIAEQQKYERLWKPGDPVDPPYTHLSRI